MAGKSNSALRQILGELGWSPYELARQVNRHLPKDRQVHPTTAFAWRDRGTLPRPPLPAVIAGVLTEAYGMTVAVDQLWPKRVTPTAVWQPAVADMEADRWAPEATVALLTRSSHIGDGSSRTYFPVSGIELNAFAQSWAFGNQPVLAKPTSTGTTLLASEYVDYLEADLTHLRRLDDGYGGRVLMRTVEIRLAQIAEILRDCTYTTDRARRLLSVAGQMAQMAGWIAFDHGDQGLAQRMYLVGLRAASAAGNRTLGALILSCIALQQSWRGRGQDAAAIMRAVEHGLRQPLPPRAQAVIAIRRARAFADVGRAADTAAALEDARAALDVVSQEAEPQWSYWVNLAVVTGEAGRCHLQLGNFRKAEIYLSDSLIGLSADSTRDQVLYGISRALALVRDHRDGKGDVAMACHQVDQILPLVPQVGSARCRALLQTVLSELRPHRTAAVRDLLDKSAELSQPQVC